MFEVAPASHAFNQTVKNILMGTVYPTRRVALIPTAPFRNGKEFFSSTCPLVSKQIDTHWKGPQDESANYDLLFRSANAVEKFAGP